MSQQLIQWGRSVLLVFLGLALAGLFFLLWSRLPWQQAALEETLSWQRVRDIQVSAEIDPEAQELKGQAVLRLEWQGPASGSLYFQLNPGLSVSRAQIGDAELKVQRDGTAIWVQLEEAPPEFDLTVHYAGALDRSTPHPAHGSAGEVILPAWSWWYPTVPHASYTFRGEVSVPEDFEVVGAGVLDNHRIAVNERHVAWREARPVFGASIAAGRYAKSTRWLDDLWLNVYWPHGEAFEARALLDSAEQSHRFLEGLLGDDGFPTLNIVLSPAVSFPFHGSNSMIFLPYPLPESAPLELLVARALTGNWWGGTVAARWTTTRAEAGAWMIEGMREVHAYRSYQMLRGKDALTRYLEQQQPLRASELGLNERTIEDFWKLTPEERHDFSRLSGAVARLLAHGLGEEAFGAACQRLLQIHRFASVSSAALQHELELASGASLDTFFAQWFDDLPDFDYAIVHGSDMQGEVRITIQNLGAINLEIPLEIAVVSGNVVEIHEISAPAYAAEIPLPIRGELRGLLLDPHALTPDGDRSNNLYPNRFFPEALTMTNTAVEISLADDPWRPSVRRTLTLSHRLEELSSAVAEGEIPRTDRPTALEASKNWQWNEGQLRDPDGNEIAADGVTITTPVEGSLAVSAIGNPAWLDEDGRLWGVRQTSEDRVAELWLESISAFAWTDTAQPRIAAIETQGSILYYDMQSDQTQVILDRQRPVVQARISHNGSHVAWLEANGLLRIAALANPIPLYATVRGEVLDFAWTPDGAWLLALTRETQAALPSPLTAVYHIGALEPNGTRSHERDLGPLLIDAASHGAAGLGPVLREGG